MLYGTGVRISELAALDVDDVDLDTGSVLVRSGKGNKVRIVPVGQAARRAVGDYLTVTRPELAKKLKGGPVAHRGGLVPECPRWSSKSSRMLEDPEGRMPGRRVSRTRCRPIR